LSVVVAPTWNVVGMGPAAAGGTNWFFAKSAMPKGAAELAAAKSPAAITQLLHWSHGGNKAPFDELIAVVYGELYKLASRRLSSERKDHTLRTTDIVHESYLRLVGADVDWNDHVHFYAIAAQVMRRILIDYAKNRNRDKRGGQMERLALDTAFELSVPGRSDLLEQRSMCDGSSHRIMTFDHARSVD
jgi:hypothetical protein